MVVLCHHLVKTLRLHLLAGEVGLIRLVYLLQRHLRLVGNGSPILDWIALDSGEFSPPALFVSSNGSVPKHIALFFFLFMMSSNVASSTIIQYIYIYVDAQSHDIIDLD